MRLYEYPLVAVLAVTICGSLSGCDDNSSADPPAVRKCRWCPQVSDDAVVPVGDAPATSQPVQGDIDSAGEGNIRASEWLPIDQREPYDLMYTMTDHDGEPFTLKSLMGKPVALTFIYTRCPNPNMCPAMVRHMALLQKSVAQAQLNDDVRLVMISLDPVFDTPTRLKSFGQRMGVTFDNAVMLRPDAETFRELLLEFGAEISPNSDGTFGHYMDLFMVDRQGRAVRYHTGGIWNNTAVLNDLEKLAKEPGDASAGS